ncbi:HpcH/HpaI aldolase/citrate lyase family protein [uncultured Hyphomonas sp.]|uniref:HpcH/HpaI aldolase family protein n=1 Tax=uncultured Hyphomonas sp. TaxID=225298 RepID=UPI002AABEFB4|nr:HpcH/HpaI aldolase/citrate lyase family protein [uncultured Hyphomonas sp.]
MNAFIESLSSGPAKIGLWQALANNYTAEICAEAGFDWLLFDGEHSPNTAQTLLGQLQAVAASPVHAIARVPAHDDWIIKQYLDLGFRTLLVPMVDSAEQAKAIVAATRYPPHGVRGVASSTSRAARFGQATSYLATANSTTGVIVQIESRSGLNAIEEIAAVEGVDALFIGPGDLSAALGHLGAPMADEVQSAVDDAVHRVLATGKPCGIFGLGKADADKRISQGVRFVSIGTDIGVLMNGAKALRAQFK